MIILVYLFSCPLCENCFTFFEFACVRLRFPTYGTSKLTDMHTELCIDSELCALSYGRPPAYTQI